MFRIISLLFVSNFIFFNSNTAQNGSFVQNELLLRLPKGISGKEWAKRLDASSQVEISDMEFSKISECLDVWRMHWNSTEGVSLRLLDWVKRQPQVLDAQLNFYLNDRSKNPLVLHSPQPAHLDTLSPNDPLFPDQWYLHNTGQIVGAVPNADLDADQAWEIAQGGLTPAGDTIVICVIDGGIDQFHPDLVKNLWKNSLEIPNDGLDNDGNGYVDDYRGWNVITQSDQISGLFTAHGTAVSGVLGAVGYNNIGIAGINWNIKIMFVAAPSAGLGTIADILQAYDYAWQMRKLYNVTNGAKGAFVVATNASFGINFGQPADAPLWCALYDSLGAQGIINVAATVNANVNVDEEGDLPTACSSDFLLTVTSLDAANARVIESGWGSQSVDIGAYGTDILTTQSGGTYGQESGTSFAAPQVAGAVGLLYAAPCSNLISVAKSNPPAAAFWAKSVLMENSHSVLALQGITQSGGKLNLNTPLVSYQEQCSDCLAPFGLRADSITDSAALLWWYVANGVQKVDLQYRVKGSNTWLLLNDVHSPLTINALLPCTTYEVRGKGFCDGTQQSLWSNTVEFQTGACCNVPPQIWLQTPTTLAWTDVGAGKKYVLRFRRQNETDWLGSTCDSAFFLIQNWLPCTDYEVQVKTLCDTTQTGFSPSFWLKTIGCGTCTDAVYCDSKSLSAWSEWIARVQIGDWVHQSAGGQGYEAHYASADATALAVAPNTMLPLQLTPGYLGSAGKEYFRVFIDYNMDGDFDDDGEIAFDPHYATNTTLEGTLAVPDFDLFGLTRMRIAMKYNNNLSEPPFPCETFGFGQVEDFCVRLMQATEANQTNLWKNSASLQLQLAPNPVVDQLNITIPRQGNGQLKIYDAAGHAVLAVPTIPSTTEGGAVTIDVGQLPSGFYWVQYTFGKGSFWGRFVKK